MTAIPINFAEIERRAKNVIEANKLPSGHPEKERALLAYLRVVDAPTVLRLIGKLSEVDELVDTADQCLDDMGADGKCVCGKAKAALRVAIEPFLTRERRLEVPLAYTYEAAVMTLSEEDRR